MRLALNHLPFNIAMIRSWDLYTGLAWGCSKFLIGHLIATLGSGIRIFSSLVAN